ncbi:MAG: hypothetical protein IJB60_09250 [Bacteroidaceae bacterium]|nr:hypothetical protein [Bacteroidaceae bacterium]MBQ3189595.1 hypothetical protein [Bacteroidaceae bacterium]
MENNENKRVNSKKELLSQRMKDKYPDVNFDDDENLFGRINDDFDGFDNLIKDYKDRESKLAALFSDDPRSAEFLMNWMRGENPMVQLVKTFGTMGLKNMLEDENMLEEVAKANTEYLQKVAKAQKLEEQFEKNIEQSLKDVETLNESEEDIDNAVNWITRLVTEAQMGIYKPENIQMAIKAINYDRNLEEVAYEAEVRGRNAKIEEKMRQLGDGTPQLGSRNIKVKTTPKQGSIFDIAQEAK